MATDLRKSEKERIRRKPQQWNNESQTRGVD